MADKAAAMSDKIALFDADGQLFWANSAFRRVADPAIGAALHDVIQMAGGWKSATSDGPDGGTLLCLTPDTSLTSRPPLELVFNALGEAVCVLDTQLRVVWWNISFLAVFDIAFDRISVGMPIRDLIDMSIRRGDLGPGDQVALLDERMAQIAGSGGFRRRLWRVDGPILDVRQSNLPDGGRLLVYSDVTDRVRSDEAQRQIMQAIALPLVVARMTDGLVLAANQPALEMFGLTAEVAIGKVYAQEFYVDSEDRQRMVRDTMAGGGRLDAREVHMGAVDGRRYWVLLSAREFSYQGQHAILTCINNITARRNAEQELAAQWEQARAARDAAERALAELKDTQAHMVQTEKMAALGALVAGVAHEVNTPIGITLTSASLLFEQTRHLVEQYGTGKLRKPDFEEYTETAIEATQLMLMNIDRASKLIQSFKQIAVDQTSEERRVFDLCAYVHEVMRSLGVRLRRTALTVEVTCPDGLVLDSFPGAISQVITNFVINSLMHGYEAGQAGLLTVTITEPTADEVQLVYADDGRGIPLELQGKVFDPFFTTRRGGGGSGLGLHIIYNIATRRLGGRITLKSAPGAGATFTLRFPKVTAAGNCAPMDVAAQNRGAVLLPQAMPEALVELSL